MEIHASCAAREGAGVLLLGSPGAGKSDLLLRLLDLGFGLVADDRVTLDGVIARALPGGEGLLEVRGLGIMNLPYVASARIRLAVRLEARQPDRLPHPARWDVLDVPAIDLDPASASAALRVGLALDCVLGRVSQRAGAFCA